MTIIRLVLVFLVSSQVRGDHEQCCKHKIVGDHGYTLVTSDSAVTSEQGCKSGCIYYRDDTGPSGGQWCFAAGAKSSRCSMKSPTSAPSFQGNDYENYDYDYDYNDYDYDYYLPDPESYMECEDNFCIPRQIGVYVESEKVVEGTKLIVYNSDYYNVATKSLKDIECYGREPLGQDIFKVVIL